MASTRNTLLISNIGTEWPYLVVFLSFAHTKRQKVSPKSYFAYNNLSSQGISLFIAFNLTFFYILLYKRQTSRKMIFYTCHLFFVTTVQSLNKMKCCYRSTTMSTKNRFKQRICHSWISIKIVYFSALLSSPLNYFIDHHFSIVNLTGQDLCAFDVQNFIFFHTSSKFTSITITFIMTLSRWCAIENCYLFKTFVFNVFTLVYMLHIDY